MWGRGIRTGNTEDGPVLKFGGDCVLNFTVCFVVNGCYGKRYRISTVLGIVKMRKIVPVASSRIKTLVSMTSARASDTNER